MRRGTVLLLAVVAAVGLSLAPAGATGRHGDGHRGDVLVVDQSSHRKTCYGKKHRVFRTIQAAVDRAEAGDTIKVCPGLYKENVKVDEEDLTILGPNAGRDATGKHRHREAVVNGDDLKGTVQLLADDITWDGFTIRGDFGKENGPGMYTSPATSGHLIRDTIFFDNGVGIHLGASGERPTLVCRNRFVANNEFAAGGFGVFSDEGARDVAITYNKFEGHNGAGIFFADSTTGIRQHDIVVEKNKSVDDKTFATFYASSRVRVTKNHVRARVGDTEFPDEVSAIFVGARNDDVVVQKNKVTAASGNGLDVTDSGEPGNPPGPPTNVALLKNKVSHAGILGISVSASGVGQYDVIGNRATANPTGIHLGPDTDDVVVDGNTALENELDCQDRSGPGGTGTAGTENGWQHNVGVTDDPNGLCAPPVVDDTPGHDGDGKDHGKKHKKKSKKHHKKPGKKHRPDPCACALHPRSM
jgi:nitrous oxidase accessory protein NosD